MQKSQERMIDGLNIQVSQLPAMRSLKIFHKLTSVLGPTLAQLSHLSNKSLDSIKVSELGQGVQTLFANLSDRELERLTKELLSTATADNAPIVSRIDLLFQGRILTLFKVLAFAIEVNYSDFFDAAKRRGLSAGLLARVESQSSPLKS